MALSGLIALLAPLTCFGPNFFLNAHTRYCPLTHQFSAGAACFVLDERAERVLVQHANLSDGEAHFEILEGSRSREFKIPESITVLTPTSYAARLIPGAQSAVTIDGVRVDLDEI